MADTKLGLWKDDNLAATISRHSGNRYYQSLPDEVQFVHSVAKILAIRRVKDKEALCAAPSLYILGAVPECVTVARKREPTFSLGGVDVSGKVWFGFTAMNSSNGFTIPPEADADAIFTFISQILASGDRPTIYFDGAASKATIRFYPKGVDEPDVCEDVPFDGALINEATIKTLLDKIHERTLISPTASMHSGKLWKDGGKGYPATRVESIVQGIIENGLAPSLGNVRVKREETGVSGRYDLALIEQDPLEPSKNTNHAILELKVIRACTCTGQKVPDTINQAAVLKGVKQAFAYRKEHGSRFSALCCYDMRPSPNLHKHTESGCKIASKLDVKFWAWPLFPTTEALRNWLVENQSNTGS